MLTLLLSFVLAQSPPAKAIDLDVKWGKNISAIEAKLREHPPKEGGVMFAGSSTIVRWDLDKYFPGKGYANVGFGGSKLSECVYFTPRILQPFKPGTVVISCGGNDIAAGVMPEQVAEDFKAFVAAIRKTSPSCRIMFTSIKPTLKREANWDKEQKANTLIRDICTKGDRLTFIDLTMELLGADGKAKREMLVDDLLHPSHEAYVLMAAKVKNAIEKAPALPAK
jgi:lysophospholipase L1-like esterase